MASMVAMAARFIKRSVTGPVLLVGVAANDVARSTIARTPKKAPKALPQEPRSREALSAAPG